MHSVYADILDKDDLGCQTHTAPSLLLELHGGSTPKREERSTKD